VKFRIVAFSAVCVVVATGALVGYGVFSTDRTSRYVTKNVDDLLDRTSKESLQRLAAVQAAVIRTEVDSAFEAARNMARSLEVVVSASKDSGSPAAIRRAQLNEVLLGVLKDHPRFNGTYSAWMPDAIDGNDKAFVNRAGIGSDATGRALPYWTRDAGGKIALQPLVEYDSSDLHSNGLVKGGWFINPMKTGQENILAPLPYIVQGKSVHLATMSVPITVGGKFMGVAGADFDLDFVQALALKVNASVYDGKGTIGVVSNNGLVIASSAAPTAIGNLATAVDRMYEKEKDILQEGRAAITVDTEHDMLRVYSPIKLGRTGMTWSAVIKVPRAVVMAEANSLSSALSERGQADVFWQVIAAIGVGGLAVVVMMFLGRGITNPIIRLTGALRRLADGESLAEIAGADRRDEIGDIARAVEGIRVKAAEKAQHEAVEKAAADALAAETARAAEVRDAQQKIAADEKAAADRKLAMNKLADQFEKTVGAIIENVSSASSELETAATTMTKAADTTQELSSAVASASEQASANVQSVASAAEEMIGSIGEISRRVQESSTIADAAVQQAAKTDARISELSQAAGRIGDVVKPITAIAEQTNLLALNATIEAARAGQSGKGFAVVAQEVKALAAQTGKATGDIANQIAGMQTATQDSVSAIKKIGITIGKISQIASSISVAVEEQGATTQDIARNVHQTAAGTAQVASNIVTVNRGASETGKASAQVLTSAQSLASESNHLKSELRKFLQTVRAA
jgi:methyl-accepting chemotaxis protein